MSAPPAPVARAIRAIRFLAVCIATAGCASQSAPRPDVNSSSETQQRAQIAATSLEDTVVVDCQLPGKLRQLGGRMNYLTPGQLVRASTLDCRTRGGQYTLGDLSSGTLSLKRWLPLAEEGNAEAQYYVARIYANGMSGVAVDYQQAAHWYKLAADQNYNAALQELGYLYEQGLGVPRDQQLALNLQRKASGLGEQLDYAWKIEEAKESAEKQIEALSARLESTNAELVQSRSELLVLRDSLSSSRAEARRNAAAIAELKGKLEAARSSSTPADTKRVKELEIQLTASEGALHSAQQHSEKLAADLNAREAELQASMARSQAASLELNEIVAARRSENDSHRSETESLRASLAQANERLLRTQQELTEARTQYQRGIQRLAEQRDEIESRSKAADAGSALLAAKQRDIDRQQAQLQQLEAALAASQRDAVQSAASGSARASAVETQNTRLRQQLEALRAEHNAALNELASQRQALASAQSRSSAEREAVIQQIKLQMQQQWARSNQELQAKERHITSLEDELNRLNGDVHTLQAERDQQRTQQAGAQQALRSDLDAARSQLLQLQQKFEKAQTDAAREHQQLLQVESQLDQERAMGAHNAQVITTLNAEIKNHLATIKADEDLVATLKQQLATTTTVVAMRSPASTATQTSPARPAAAPPISAQLDKYLGMARNYNVQHPGRLYALLIANSNYQHIPKLLTPLNDTRDLEALLVERYGYEVDLLTDATRRDIMLKLNDYANRLQENDSLLVYFAGHGDRATGPPERAYWLGVEADPKTNEGYLEVEFIQAKIKQMNARQILLVADSCFSGAIARGSTVRIGRGLNESMLTQEMSHRARMVLTSGGDAPVPDTGNETGHSLFAGVFIRTLRQNSTVLSGEMLAHEVYAEVTQTAANLHVVQVPTYAHLSDANHDFGDYFFTPQPLPMLALDRE